MKNFQNYMPKKYSNKEYEKIEEGIYSIKNQFDEDEIFVTSLSFEIEKECYGEEESSPEYISQVPFEDLLDEFFVFVSDFYEELNENSENTCYIEFGAPDLDDIKNLRTIIGKRFYAVSDGKIDGYEAYNTIIE